MAWTLDSSGTQAAVIGTEHVLATSTSNGTFVLATRHNNMAAGDIAELRVYTMTLTGGTLEQSWKCTIGPMPPANIAVQSPPIPSDMSIKVTLKQVAGTGRSYDWKLLRV